ncbi:hypothetical protein CMQ_7886 [Grosmannia clavigera kw1407]|uniref:DUF2470 domain-containing protein n=1 Tax=Grosmannia clavigera (strain kw1407 / UAMH 11150) TaxID=655863 RepID=F0XRT6_GROCL|nr:uncharacterized protein CMQ_7886 [Grosmannia clavigera kw1407]EFW99518.1 hypothetical protein CMQ_7886 [Grosmannia clavigera kw1407]
MAEIDDKSRQQVLRHMNANHRLDLGLYLRHVNGLSAQQLAAEGEPEMLDIDLQTIRIRTATSGRVYVILIKPSMTSWAECRTRLVSMAKEARIAYGIPLPEYDSLDKKPAMSVIPYHLPVGADYVVLGGVVIYAVMAVLVFTGHDNGPANVWSKAMTSLGVPPPSSITSTSGSLAVKLSTTIGGSSGFRRVVHAILRPMVAIHLTEVWWLDRTRLAPHKMRRGSRDWILWTVSTFWEGFRAFGRFDTMVAAKAASAEPRKP